MKDASKGRRRAAIWMHNPLPAYHWHLLLWAISSFAIPSSVQAVPMIDKSQAVAGPRAAAGTGLCGSVTHFMAAQPVGSQADAVILLNKPATDPAILGRTARLFDNINFRNGQPNTNGDFTLPNYRNGVFPYSLDPIAAPMGTDSNIALRLRGYFNVPATLIGKTISIGVNCDDFCSLRVGSTTLMPAGNELVSARVIKQVTFKDAGLYPIEMVYYQTGATAYLEWARTDNAVPECPNDICRIPLTDSTTYAGQFKLIQKAELYSAVVGENPSCQECGAPGMDCSTGNYCGDGLCQACNVPDHCGPGCVKCPQNTYICSSGKCIQCVSDPQCPNGQICDIPNGKCVVAPPPCSRNDQCLMPWICDLKTNRCQNPLIPCTMDSMCPVGLSCLGQPDGIEVCKVPPAQCNTTKDCPDWQYCDDVMRVCHSRDPVALGDGCSGSPLGNRDPSYLDLCMPNPPCPPGAACDHTKNGQTARSHYPHQQICGCGIFPAQRVPHRLSSTIPLLFFSILGWLGLRRWRRKPVEAGAELIVR